MQFRRLAALTLLLAAAFVGLGYRLVDLQVVRHPELALEARGNTQYTNHLEPHRGDILDINGNLLATSYFVKTVCANPAVIAGHETEVARVIAPLLQMNPEEVARKLEPHYLYTRQGAIITNQFGKPVTNQYVLLKRRVPEEAWEKIQIAITNLPVPGYEGAREKKAPSELRKVYHSLRYRAISADPVDEQVRSYPNGALAAHVLGFVGMTEETNKGLAVSVTTGEAGIERRFDTKLKGVRGWRVTERDSRQHELVDLREQDVKPCDGLNVVLTIDSVIQHILEVALAEGMKKNLPASISGLVIRPRTGEILGMATLPNYDPNHSGEASPDVLRNRIISDVEEPGSTFKIVVVSGALNDGIVKLTDKFNCEHGQFLYAGKILHDHKPYDILTVEGIITKSSNIGAAKIGLAMHEQRLYEYMRAFGFGTATGILPGETAGLVRPPDGIDSKGVFHRDWKWSELSITRIPMGHEVGVTCLQMAMAMCAVANKGVLMQPMLVDRLVEPDGTVAMKNLPQAVRTVISPEAAHDMVEALKTVVTSDGTAAGAALTNYTVAGKTGTAQKPDPRGGYYSDKFFSSFVGFFPADNPEICIYVAMDSPKDGHYGGDTAAPIFHEIAEKAANYLNIRPDKGNPTGLPEISRVGTEPPVKTAAAAPLEKLN